MNDITKELSSKYEIVLASSSPRRYEILREQMGFQDITLMKPSFEEDLDKTLYDKKPIDYVRDTCNGKKDAILQELQLKNSHGRKIVICADTIVVDYEDKIYEKPITKDIQRCNLLAFKKQNGPLKVITAVTIILWSNREEYETKSFHEITKVYFDGTLPDRFINTYVESGDGLQVAGGFKVQGFSACFVNKIEGDYYNVVGLPIAHTWRVLADLL